MSVWDWLGYLDWITPAVSLVQQSAGKAETFVISQSRVDETIRLLDRAGVRMKNTSFLPGKFAFDVDPKDADLVERLLR